MPQLLTKTRKRRLNRKSGQVHSFVKEESAPRYNRSKQAVVNRSRRSKIENSVIFHVMVSGKRWLVVPHGQVRAIKSLISPDAAVRYAKKQAPQTWVVLHNEDGEVEKVYK